MKSQKFSIKKRLLSFKYAFNGLKILLAEEHNSRIHVFAAFVVILGGIYFNITVFEWIAVLLCIGFVIALEIVNSAIENIADFISPEKNDKIKTIKDLMAAAVLISAIIAVAIAFFIFAPKIKMLF